MTYQQENQFVGTNQTEEEESESEGIRVNGKGHRPLSLSELVEQQNIAANGNYGGPSIIS